MQVVYERAERVKIMENVSKEIMQSSSEHRKRTIRDMCEKVRIHVGYIHTHTCVCERRHMHTHIQVCVSVDTYIHTHIHVCVSVDKYIHTYL